MVNLCCERVWLRCKSLPAVLEFHFLLYTVGRSCRPFAFQLACVSTKLLVYLIALSHSHTVSLIPVTIHTANGYIILLKPQIEIA